MMHAPASEHEKPDYHGHPNYFATWGALLTLFLASVGLGYAGHSTAAVALIFGLATVKAVLVGANFMHLRWEPKLVLVFVGFGVLCLGFFYFGVLPDIVWVPAQLAK